MLHNCRRMMFVAACAVAIFGLLIPQAAQAGSTTIQIHLDHWQNGCTPTKRTTCPDQTEKWIDGNLHNTNSTYVEGDTVPTRFVMENLPAGTHKLTFSWLAAKDQKNLKHAHDYIRIYNASYTPGVEPFAVNPDPCLPLVQGGGKVPTGCSGSPTSSLGVPTDPKLIPGNGWNGPVPFPVGETFKMWNGTMSTVTGYTYSPDPPFTKTTSNSLAITFTTAGGTVVLALGAHLANDGDWSGGNNGAAGINGAPYHWEYSLVDSAGNREAGGNRDRSIMVEAAHNVGSISIIKKCIPNDVPASFDFAATNPAGVDGLPATFTIGCSADQGAVIAGAGGQVFTVTETQHNGWDLSGISCASTSGGSSTFKYLGYTGTNSPAPDAFQFGDNRVEITFAAGDSVACTFTNRQAQMPVNKFIAGRTPDCTGVTANQLGFLPPSGPCTDSVVGTLPIFQLNLYPANPVGQPCGFLTNLCSDFVPFGIPAFSVPLATIYIPPEADPQGPINIPFTICEVTIPSGWFLDANGVTLTDTPNTSPTTTAYTPDGSTDRNRCFNILIPTGTTEFRIDVNDIPRGTITVIKNTVGGDGKFDFTGTGGGGLDSGFSLTTSSNTNPAHTAQTSFTVDARVNCGGLGQVVCYGLSEDGVPLADWVTTVSCTGGTGGTGAPANFGVAPGETVTCTFTNKKKPRLIVIKHVVNGDIGTNVAGDFSISVSSAASHSPASFAGVESPGTTVTFTATGSYSVSETGPSGYTEVDSADCTGSVTWGDVKTCTITNYKNPELKVVKKLFPSNDPGRFDLINNNITYNNGGAGYTDGGNTGFQPVSFGSAIVVGEAGHGSTLLSNYVKDISCDAGTVTGSAPTWSLDLSDKSKLTGKQVTCTITNRRGSMVTDSALCTFDVDPNVAGRQFRLLYGGSLNSTLNASNPGQFFYNVFYAGSGNTTLTLTLPYPFVTQEGAALPIHIYSGVTFSTGVITDNNSTGATCLTPGTEIDGLGTKALVPLTSYSSQSFATSNTATVNVPIPNLPGGFAYINIHLDYGLKGTTGWTQGASNLAIGTHPPPDIVNFQSYSFSDTSPSGDSVQSENSF